MLIRLIAVDPNRDALQPVAADLRAGLSNLDRRTRVAVVGQIKRGKSTLVNAMLGRKVAATGQLELTFNINEFAQPEGDGPERILIHYRGSGAARVVGQSDLDKVTAREPHTLTMVRDIERIVFEIRHALLADICLVDTPGLGSVRGADSANALSYLGIELSAEETRLLDAIDRHSDQISTDSQNEMATADAIVYLFSRGRLHTRDREVVLRFLGNERMQLQVNPLRAVGVLSSCDLSWSAAIRAGHDPWRFDPLKDDAQPQIDRFMNEEPDIRQLFHTILPVAGLLAEGAYTITDDHLEALADLSRVDPDRVVRWLRDIGEFTRPDLPGSPISAAMAKDLAQRLGAWGVHLATTALRHGGSEAQVRQELYDRSGLPDLTRQIRAHFGARSYFINLEKVLTTIERNIRDRIRRSNLAASPYPPLMDELLGRVVSLRENEHGFAELAVLREHYQGRLGFDAAGVRELLQVTGECGASLRSRLGLPESASVAETRAVAMSALEGWARRALDPALDGVSRAAAATIRKSLGNLLSALTDEQAGEIG
jgi:GTPase SAR1 family protein